MIINVPIQPLMQRFLVLKPRAWASCGNGFCNRNILSKIISTVESEYRNGRNFKEFHTNLTYLALFPNRRNQSK